ncbi:hypothetical protein NDN01_23345 [Sphingomonas sp. QA11]|uniref:hypothetical protein n=1 Tax=Sphingomonas sp. QA11 TaxID=2950605 RepID=UPI00234B34B8|nr:hypothetical protein [Sphingomonas sp. QA11]WCM26890.1 hypothetical protein NDN01_23345 [Sphingomonas sp. QA11]
MHRRSFIASALTALLVSTITPPAFGQGRVNRTQWKVRSSEGLDAIAFLGPLSGTKLYTDIYGQDVAAFAPKLPDAVRNDIPKLWAAAGKEGFGLLGPTLSVLFSANGNDATIGTLLTALRSRTDLILPSYKASPYWDAGNWAWFDAAAPRLDSIFSAMHDAGFAAFRADRIGADLDTRIADMARALKGFDVISLQEKLTGRTFDPEIQIVLLHFCKPHGIKVQGQMFLQSAEYDTATTVRIAAHEMLHPPVKMDGPAATAALAIFARDPLIVKIVREHDPRWGYTTLEGMLNEDLAQALDQLISEALGVARNPADRWRKSDDGMHVLAAGLYGMLRQDRWVQTGGSIEQWLADAAAGGRLAPATFHPVAARVLERPVDALWPLPPETRA